MGTKETVEMFFKIVIFLPFIVFLIYLFFKYGGSKLQDMQNGRFMKVLDRMALSKENSLLVVKIGNDGYVISSSQGKVEILMKLSEEEVLKMEQTRKIDEYGSIKEAMKKLKVKRKDNNEKKEI